MILKDPRSKDEIGGAGTRLEKLDACKDKLALFALCQIGILEEL